MASNWLDEANQTAKKYSDAIKKQSQYLIDQQNQSRQNVLNSIENQRINTINNLNSNKDTIKQTALDNARQANINRMLSLKDNEGAMSRAGLDTQGIVGSQVNSINNNYGTNLNTILKDKANSLQGVNDQINSANIQYDTNRLNAINEYDSNIAALQNQIDQQALNQYNIIYQQVLAQKQQEYKNQLAEAQRQEAIRQFNIQRSTSSSPTSQYSFSNTGSSSNNIKTDYYSGSINPDTKYGTFGTLDKNGVKYQPDNVGGEKLSSSGKRISDYFGKGTVTGASGANMDNQRVWKTRTGNYYVWDGSQNKYVDITRKIPSLAAGVGLSRLF